MSSWLLEAVSNFGYGTLFCLMVLENVFPPMPSEVILPFAGYMVAQDNHTLWGVIVAGTFGSVVGALMLYWLGACIGEARLIALARRHGRWFTVSEADLEKAMAWFRVHGWWAVLICRLIPGLRSLISIPAGITRMPLLPFIAVTVLGTAVWATALVLFGYWLGTAYHIAGKYIGAASLSLLGAVAVLYAVRVARYRPDR